MIFTSPGCFIKMYTDEDGRLAIDIARKTIESYLKDETVPEFKVPEHFKNKSGVFVTLNRHPKHDLRGCIGYPEPHAPLIDAITDSAINAATRDPRFPSVTLKEMDKIIVEVSLLTPPEPLEAKNPKDYLEKIKIGRDGLIVEKGMSRGLLLPQVPVEWKWDVETFLSHTCMKAGLSADCWLRSGTKFYRFSAEVFTEDEPRGTISKKIL
jgi:uncharacterized protein (TIGR00296 family)